MKTLNTQATGGHNSNSINAQETVCCELFPFTLYLLSDGQNFFMSITNKNYVTFKIKL